MLNKIHDTVNSVTLKKRAKIQKKNINSDVIDTDSDSSHEMADILKPKKKAKRDNLSTITLSYLHSKEEKYENKTYEKNKNAILHQLWDNNY